jgi:hypothetical protein
VLATLGVTGRLQHGNLSRTVCGGLCRSTVV